MRDIVFCTIIKDEACYLDEWLYNNFDKETKAKYGIEEVF